MTEHKDDDIRRLEKERDPRGGRQSSAYRRADPRDLVVEGDVAMSGPGGAPQEREPELRERKRRSRRRS
jgi:hypothetical protein